MLSSNIGAITSWNLVYNMEQIFLVSSFPLSSRGRGSRTFLIHIQFHFLLLIRVLGLVFSLDLDRGGKGGERWIGKEKRRGVNRDGKASTWRMELLEVGVWARCEVDRRPRNGCGPVSMGQCISPAKLFYVWFFPKTGGTICDMTYDHMVWLYYIWHKN